MVRTWAGKPEKESIFQPVERQGILITLEKSMNFYPKYQKRQRNVEEIFESKSRSLRNVKYSGYTCKLEH